MTATRPTKLAPELLTVERIRNLYADPARRLAADWGQMFGHIQVLLSVVDELHAKAAADRPWNEAVDWLINSPYCGEPEAQDPFWALADGLCTRDEASRGYMADGRTIHEVRNAHEAGEPA